MRTPWLSYEKELEEFSSLVLPRASWERVCLYDNPNMLPKEHILLMHVSDASALGAVVEALESEHVMFIGYGDIGFLGGGADFSENLKMVSCRVDAVSLSGMGDTWLEWMNYAHLPATWASLEEVQVYMGYAVRKSVSRVLVSSVARRYSSELT